MKRWMAFLLCVLLCAMSFAPAALGEQAKTTLKEGARGDEVVEMQARLITLGFLDGKADGIFGKGTKAAVTSFQKHLKAQGRSVTVDGVVGPKMWEVLLDDSYSTYLQDVTLDQKSDEAKRLQKRLIALNYLDDTADGHFGVDSQAALIAFERAHGLPEDGAAGEADFAALFSDGAIRAERPVRRTISTGDKGKGVAELQRLLIRMGFLAGVDDGYYSDATATAMERLRKHLKDMAREDETLNWVEELFDSTTTASPLLQEKLIDTPLPVYVKDVTGKTSGDSLRRVQRRLHTLLYLDVTGIDGKFGKGTREAIRTFQENNGMEPTGTLDQAAQQVLYSEGAVGRRTEYQLHVSIGDQRVYVYRLQEDGTYELEREMVCTTGMASAPTPTGIFTRTRPLSRWHYFKKFNCWAKNTFQITGNIWFHSVLFYGRSDKAISRVSVNNLGRRASHGCVRLTVEDSAWVYETCPSGTPVIIR